MSFVESRNGNPPRLSSPSTHRDHQLSKASRTVRLLFGEISRLLRRDVTCCASAPSLRWLHTAVDLLLPVIALLGDPCCRRSSASGAPGSACFKIPVICSTEKRFLFTTKPPSR